MLHSTTVDPPGKTDMAGASLISTGASLPEDMSGKLVEIPEFLLVV